MLAVQETDETVSLIPIEPDQLGLIPGMRLVAKHRERPIGHGLNFVEVYVTSHVNPRWTYENG